MARSKSGSIFCFLGKFKLDGWIKKMMLKMRQTMARTRSKYGSKAFSIALGSWGFLTAVANSLKFKLFFMSGLMILVTLFACSHLGLKQGNTWLLRPERNEQQNLALLQSPDDTILVYTLMDPGEAAEREKVKQILDGSLEGSGRFRYHWHLARGEKTGSRFDYLDRPEVYDRRTQFRRYRDNTAMDISNPKYAPYMGRFRQLLQAWVRNKRYEPHIMKDLLSTVKSSIDRFYTNKSMITSSTIQRYTSCAVVGNSGILLNRSYGMFIDNHEAVIRLNNARIDGFENWVGSKTTFSFINSNILHTCTRRVKCSCQPYKEIVPTVSYMCQILHFMDVAYCEDLQGAPLLITDPRFDILCTRIVKYYSLKKYFDNTGRSYEEWNKIHDGALFHYSSGMQAIMLALGICDKVDLFGFGKDPNSKHHYHTNQNAELALHDYEAEYMFYRALSSKSGFIPFLSESGVNLPPLTIFG